MYTKHSQAQKKDSALGTLPGSLKHNGGQAPPDAFHRN